MQVMGCCLGPQGKDHGPGLRAGRGRVTSKRIGAQVGRQAVHSPEENKEKADEI